MPSPSITKVSGTPVTPHAVRKWLIGEAIPTQEKILVLAKWLNVSAAWLRFGDTVTEELPESAQDVEIDETAIYREVLELTKPSQRVVKNLVESLKQLEKSVIPQKGRNRQKHTE